MLELVPESRSEAVRGSHLLLLELVGAVLDKAPAGLNLHECNDKKVGKVIYQYNQVRN